MSLDCCTVMKRVHEGLEDGCILEMNGDDAAAADHVVGRLDALDHGVGSSAGDEGARLAVLIGLKFPPGMVEEADEKALRVPHLNLSAA